MRPRPPKSIGMVWVLEHSQLSTKNKFMVEAYSLECVSSGWKVTFRVMDSGVTSSSFQPFIPSEVRNIPTPELLEEFDPWPVGRGLSLKGVGGSG